jgi:hypothetical protein
VKKTYDAEFSEVFDFAARGSAPFSTLTLTLMDWDKMSKDDYIGEVAFALTPEALAKDQVHVLNVKDKSNGGKRVTGHDGQATEVHVKVTAVAEVAPQPQPDPHTAPISQQPRAIAASLSPRGAECKQIQPMSAPPTLSPRPSSSSTNLPAPLPPTTPGGTATGGIGLKFKVKNGGPVVDQVKAKGPCDRVGIRSGDRIEAVDGETIQRGKEGDKMGEKVCVCVSVSVSVLSVSLFLSLSLYH